MYRGEIGPVGEIDQCSGIHRTRLFLISVLFYQLYPTTVWRCERCPRPVRFSGVADARSPFVFSPPRTPRSSKTGVGKVYNISQRQPIGTVKLGETGSGVRDLAWLPAQQVVNPLVHRTAFPPGTFTWKFREKELTITCTGPVAICEPRGASERLSPKTLLHALPHVLHTFRR